MSCYAGVEMDGYRYYGVPIGDQCWFAENLRTTVYADGTSIPEVTDDDTWSDLSSGARCDYENDTSTPHRYSKLYNWYAVDDSRGLCPSGWHVPLDEEWTDLWIANLNPQHDSLIQEIQQKSSLFYDVDRDRQISDEERAEKVMSQDREWIDEDGDENNFPLPSD